MTTTTRTTTTLTSSTSPFSLRRRRSPLALTLRLAVASAALAAVSAAFVSVRLSLRSEGGSASASSGAEDVEPIRLLVPAQLEAAADVGGGAGGSVAASGAAVGRLRGGGGGGGGGAAGGIARKAQNSSLSAAAPPAPARAPSLSPLSSRGDDEDDGYYDDGGDDEMIRGGGGSDGGPRRFPPYGTAEYSSRCGWLLNAANGTENNCTIYYGLDESRKSEGISFWAAQIASNHLLAIQAGCRLLFDYGPAADIGHVVASPGESALFDWTVPEGYRCESDPNCYRIPSWELRGKTVSFQMPTMRALAPVPRYRYAYSLERFTEEDVEEGVEGKSIASALRRTLPGFRLEDGMACSLGALMSLAPSAAEYEPRLFESILPTLRDPDALVLGVYARTGWADIAAKQRFSKMKGLLEEDGTTPTEAAKAEMLGYAKMVADAALVLERRFLTKRKKSTKDTRQRGRASGGGNNSTMVTPMNNDYEEREFKRIVWMVTTDWPYVKTWMAERYNGTDANANANGISNGTAPDGDGEYDWKYPIGTVIARTIITTSKSRGRHTRYSAKPRPADFAEAFLDWYLLGETDAVVKWRYSFAETAALRTAADVYQGDKFKPLVAKRGTTVAVNETDGSILDVDPPPSDGGGGGGGMATAGKASTPTRTERKIIEYRRAQKGRTAAAEVRVRRPKNRVKVAAV